MHSSQGYLYVGLDVHKKTISYCGKRSDGGLVKEGVIPATRRALAEWAPAPNPECGEDPTIDSLNCGNYPCP